MEEKVKFLGTAGARYVMSTQLRSSAGTYLEIGGRRVILDPGPGTLVRMAKSRPRINPSSIDGVILTHVHLDHCGDVNAILDAISEGAKKKKGVLFAPSQCIEGDDRVVFSYLLNSIEVVKLRPEKEYSLDDFTFSTGILHDHGVETYGIKIPYSNGKICFIVDTAFSPEIMESYKDCDIMVMNVVLTDCRPFIKHLCVENVRKIAIHLKPRQIIMTHFGMGMLKAKPWEIASRLSEETGVEIKAASDGMELHL